MFERHAEARLRKLARGFPVIALLGPRQAGKSTLARKTFADKRYLSLEDPDVRERAVRDPRSFLRDLDAGAIIDEAQRAPQLFSYLQAVVDEDRRPGKWVITGSQNFLLMSSVTQSLAGRIGFVDLFPLSCAELAAAGRLESLELLLVTGGFPALHSTSVDAQDFFRGYMASYLERDVRQLSAVRDLLQFQRFIRLLAARCGQLLNLNAVANDCGIAQSTARDWLAVLEASYIAHRLPPYFVNFGKRLVKTPKLYFHDTGLVAWLLGIRSSDEMSFHPQRGALFENLVVAEAIRKRENLGLRYDLFFWRDNIGTEIDLLVDAGGRLTPIEIKSGATFQTEWLRSIHAWERHAKGARRNVPALIFAGEGGFVQDDVAVLGWRETLTQDAMAV